MNRLLFTRADVTLFEDADFPDDPAPYVAIAARELPLYLELEEAEHLGRALLTWVREHLEREARHAREHRRKLAVLRDAAADVLAPLPLASGIPGPTVLELLEQAHAELGAMDRSAAAKQSRRDRTVGRRRRRPAGLHNPR